MARDHRDPRAVRGVHLRPQHLRVERQLHQLQDRPGGRRDGVGAQHRHHQRRAPPRVVLRTAPPALVPEPAEPRVHPVLEHLLRLVPLHHPDHPAGVAVPALPSRVHGLAELAGGGDDPRADRLRVLLGHAATTAELPRGVRWVQPARLLRRRTRPPRLQELRHRGHPRGLRRAVELRLVHDGAHLEPVHGDAQPPHRVVDLVRGGARPPGEAALGEDPGRLLPDLHAVRHPGNRQPLLARCVGWAHLADRGGHRRDPARLPHELARRTGATPSAPRPRTAEP